MHHAISVFRPDILATPAWTLVGSVMAMWSLWKWPISRRRIVALILFGLCCSGLFIESWRIEYSQAQTSDAIELENFSTRDQIGKIASRLQLDPDENTQALLKNIEKQIGPREINSEDSQSIANTLHAAGSFKFQLDIISNDRETLAFAQEFYNTLLLAGWVPFGTGVSGGDFTPGIIGVVISQNTQRQFPAAFRALRDALAKAGIVVNDDLTGNSFASGGVVEILIGPKP
jgi:hypothetical protein